MIKKKQDAKGHKINKSHIPKLDSMILEDNKEEDEDDDQVGN